MMKPISIKQLAGITTIAALIFLPVLVNAIINKSETAGGIFVAYSFLMFLLLYAFNWRKTVPILLPFILFSGIAASFLYVTKVKLGYHVYASIFETHSDEVLAFLRNPLFFKITSGAISTLLFTLIIYFKKGIPFLSKRILKIPKILLATGFILSLFIIFYGYKKNMLRMYYPGTVIHSYDIYFNELKKVKDGYLDLSYDFKGVKTDTIKENILLVVGESERKMSLNVYGYPRPTTPYINELLKTHPKNVLVFTNATTVATWTRIAVPSLLSFAKIEQNEKIFSTPSVIKAFSNIGYKTIMISNQDQTMINASNYLISAFSAETDTIVSCQKVFNEIYDQNVVNAFAPFLSKQNTGNRFFFLHLMGSHYEYADRVPESKKHFKGETLLDNYDNTVYYTDFIINEFAKKIFKKDKPYLMIYISDHGEYVDDFGDGNYGHGFSIPTAGEVEIPFLIYYNDAFYQSKKDKIDNLRKNTSKKISLDNISHTLMGLYGDIDSALYDATYDLSSPLFKENERFFLDSDNNILHLEKIQFRQKDD